MNGKKPVGLSVEIRIIREPAMTSMTPRKRMVCWDFGIPPREAPRVIVDGLRVHLTPGSILPVVGPSGSGKSSVLAAIAEQAGEVWRVRAGRFPLDRSIVDAVAPRGELRATLEILTACGLGEPRLWVRPNADLADGEQFRAALARSVGNALSRGRSRPIICDEFTTPLHRRMAKAVAFNLRKLVSRHGLILIAATTCEDIIEDLQPDRLIRLGGFMPCCVEQTPRERPPSLARRAVIEIGSVADYRAFAPMHYRHHDGLGFVDRVFLLREHRGGPPLGILVFAHAPLELALRNAVTAGRFIRQPRRLYRELRILRRLVIHPDVRGCGLGHWFVRNTLPRVGVRFVECLAAMGSVNPVFERAGMTRIGRCPLPRGRLALVRRLREWKLDPFANDFPRAVARLPRVRALVELTIRDWMNVAHGTHKGALAGRPGRELAGLFRQIIGEPPIYYLWDRDGEFPQSAGDERCAKTRPFAKPDGRRPRKDRHNPFA